MSPYMYTIIFDVTHTHTHTHTHVKTNYCITLKQNAMSI